MTYKILACHARYSTKKVTEPVSLKINQKGIMREMTDMIITESTHATKLLYKAAIKTHLQRDCS